MFLSPLQNPRGSGRTSANLHSELLYSIIHKCVTYLLLHTRNTMSSENTEKMIKSEETGGIVGRDRDEGSGKAVGKRQLLTGDAHG